VVICSGILDDRLFRRHVNSLCNPLSNQLIRAPRIRQTWQNGPLRPSARFRHSNHDIHILARNVPSPCPRSLVMFFGFLDCHLRAVFIPTVGIDSSGAAMFFGIEKFTFSESVYFVDVTVTTVGFGDSSNLP